MEAGTAGGVGTKTLVHSEGTEVMASAAEQGVESAEFEDPLTPSAEVSLSTVGSLSSMKADRSETNFSFGCDSAANDKIAIFAAQF